jgi:hypothetical protein
MNKQADPSRRRFVTAGIVVAGLASLGGLLAMIVFALEKIQNGRGLEIYRTAWLAEDTPLGFLIFLAVTLLAIGIALIFRLKEWLEVRKLLKDSLGPRNG